MLGVDKFSPRYIEACRTRVAEQVAAYQTLATVARNQAAADASHLNAAIEAFEAHFFNNMLLALDCYFVNRAREIEKKDGNPLNEVRMLCNSIMNSNGWLGADKTIKYDPAKSVLKYHIGNEIRLNEAEFVRLASAFLAEIEGKYS
jgi:hypothetical protein